MADAQKELVEKAYEAIEVARATGKIKRGANETTKALERGIAKLVVYAANTSPKEIVMHIPLLAKEKGVIAIEVPSKEELGAAAGIPVAASAVAIVDEGEASSIINFIRDELNKASAGAKSETTSLKKGESKEEAKAEEKA